MAREFIPKVVTANDLFEGDVVYFDEREAWVRTLRGAHVWREERAANAALERAISRQHEVVGAYLADVAEPLHFREEFRATGPSNYKTHGKQAELSDV